jgi:hypothetical protein
MAASASDERVLAVFLVKWGITGFIHRRAGRLYFL